MSYAGQSTSPDPLVRARLLGSFGFLSIRTFQQFLPLAKVVDARALYGIIASYPSRTGLDGRMAGCPEERNMNKLNNSTKTPTNLRDKAKHNVPKA